MGTSLVLRVLAYGLLGWCIEILWTAVSESISGVRRSEADQTLPATLTRADRLQLRGSTYLWMLPIYGLSCLAFEPVHDAIRGYHWITRGLFYTAGIFAVEAIAGLVLKKLIRRCPWDYSIYRWNVAGVIRLDYAPLWLGFGLLLERAHDFLSAVGPAVLAAI